MAASPSEVVFLKTQNIQKAESGSGVTMTYNVNNMP